MGIKNFCKLLEPFGKPPQEPDYFDSILVDMQSYLYVAIENTYQVEDALFFAELCESVWRALEKKLDALFSYAFPVEPDAFTIVLTFDGEGAPMKWPTQRNRRSEKTAEDRKSFYRQVLFGNNSISVRVKSYVFERMKHYASFFGSRCRVVVSGSDHWGEGEHKLFQIAQREEGCRHPLVLSVDQDVFILAFLRLHHFETLQIHRYNAFYNVTHLVRDVLPYPVDRLIVVSILFGNDFIPPLVEISDKKAALFHDLLQFEDRSQHRVDGAPAVLAVFLQNMAPHLKFTKVECVSRDLVRAFWLTYLWILDYYTKRDFPQLYMTNEVYDAFDRNQLITGLLDEDLSATVHREALSHYERLETVPEQDPTRFVFTNAEFLRRLEPYWVKPVSSSTCSLLVLTKKDPTPVG